MTDWTNPDDREAAVAKKWADAEAALAAANGRIAMLEVVIKDFAQIECAMEEELAAERAISDKLMEALQIAEEFVNRHSESWYISGQQDLATIRAALAEVAAIRNQETAAVKTYCGGKPNYVSEEKA